MEQRLLDRDGEQFRVAQAQVILAQLHNEASRVRKLQNFDMQNSDYCECCRLPLVINNQHAPLFHMGCDIDQLSELGIGFPLFFHFIKNSAFIMIFLFVCVGIPCLIGNLARSDHKGSDLFYDSVSLGGPNDSGGSIWQGTLHAIGAIVLLVDIIFAKRYTYNKIREIDLNLITPADFAVMATNVKEGTNLVAEFDGIGEFEVNHAYDIQDYMDQIRIHRQQWNDFYFLKHYAKTHQDIPLKGVLCWKKNYPSIQDLIEETNLTEDLLQHREQESEMEHIRTGIDFVIFKKQTDASQVLELYQRKCCKWISQSLKIKRAPEPTDILWENLHSTFGQQLKRRFVTLLVSLCILSLSFVFIFQLKQQQISKYDSSGIQNSGDFFSIGIISFLISLTIIIINTSLSVLIRVLTNKELYHSWSEFYRAVFIKVTLVLTFNSVIMLLLINAENLNRSDIYHPYGLLSDVQSLLLADTFITPLLKVMSVIYFAKLLQRRNLKKGEIDGKLGMTQASANMIWENQQPDIAQWYANTFKTMIIGVTFGPLFPLATGISFLSLLTQYWTDKWLLLRRLARPREFGDCLAKIALSGLSLVVLAYATSNVFIQNLIDPQYIVGPIIGWFVVLIYLLVPLKKFYYKTVTTDDKQDRYQSKQDNLDIQSLNFFTDYARSNPMTQKQARLKWRKLLQGNTYTENQEQILLQQTNFTKAMLKSSIEYQDRPQRYSNPNFFGYSNYFFLQKPNQAIP